MGMFNGQVGRVMRRLFVGGALGLSIGAMGPTQEVSAVCSEDICEQDIWWDDCKDVDVQTYCNFVTVPPNFPDECHPQDCL